jgi:hypothetical protein
METWANPVAHVGSDTHTVLQSENLEGRTRLKDMGEDEMIILCDMTPEAQNSGARGEVHC